MRFTAYAGASTALATGVILRAFHQRPNFYSASVYLAQSQACRMILLNLLLLCVYGFVRGLQKLLYGRLRPSEREQLWDRSWYAITETALAMTTFRDEVGAFFLIMFVTLLAGKVWGWISEGRVEILEQQPPANPRLFHARLISSLIVSVLFDIIMLQYCVYSLLYQPRPGMMVMFAFEFAVLLITSTSTAVRYSLSLHESFVVKRQTTQRLEERREEIRAAREEAQRRGSTGSSAPIPREEDLEESDVDVPGWQEKGRWILFLDLITDFLKLVVYMMFFTMLILFHGIPIHIIRDVYLTARSFIKRISDFQKYRNATRDMNTRYPDATTEELERDGTCIICREDMSPWQARPEQPAPEAAGRRPNRIPSDERQRPKKLPCGHILHLGCLKSWLERQQVCPTCRTSVLAPVPTSNNQANLPPHLQPGAPAQRGLPDQPLHNGGQPQPGNGQQNGQGRQDVRARTFNIGPWRLTFAAGNANQVRDALQRVRGQVQQEQGQQGWMQNQDNAQNFRLADALRAWRGSTPNNRLNTNNVQQTLFDLERQVVQEINSLHVAQGQLAHVRTLQAELARLRALQTQILQDQPNAQQGSNASTQGATRDQTQVLQQPLAPMPGMNNAFTGNALFGVPLRNPQLQQEVLTGGGEQQPLGPGHPDLPAGVTLPEGWSLLPLHPTAADSNHTVSAPDEVSSGLAVTPQAPITASAQSSTTGFHNTLAPEPQARQQIQQDALGGPRSSQATQSNTTDISNSITHTNGAGQRTNGLGEHDVMGTPSIPDWSQVVDATPSASERSTGASAIDEGATGSSVNGTSTWDGDNTAHSESAQTSSDKGKGKAATVEDAADDVD